MKAVLERINQTQNSSFLYKAIELPAFDALFHFHPEYELTWIQKGEGQRYVGSQMDNYSEDDLVLLGSNLPHCWISKPLAENEKVSAVVIQFKMDFLGEYFFDLPEMKRIKQLLLVSKAGIRVPKYVVGLIKEEIDRMQFLNEFQRLTSLLNILGTLSEASDLEEIDGGFSAIYHSENENLRLQRVFAYLIEHFKEDISLHEIAKVAHLSPTSFCRYFKSNTGKTFLEVINEYRIQNACQLLKRKQLSVSQIAFESGFNDISYFNKLFKKVKGVNPLAFQSS